MVHGRLMPGGDCARILSQLPPGILSIDDVLANHTLLPFYLRFYDSAKKQKTVELLRSGKGAGITNIHSKLPGVQEGLKYCPQCYCDDMNRFGEPYWHREHQIPLMPMCPKHHIVLNTYPVKFSRLSEVYVPLSSVRVSEDDPEPAFHWMHPLTDLLMAFLSLPVEAGATVDYNNLYSMLLTKGYGVDKLSDHQAISVQKVQQAAQELYGDSIYQQYFSKLSPAILCRLSRWELTSPDRYALLAAMVEMTANTLLGERLPENDTLKERLLYYSEIGTVYRKNELAQMMGVSPAQLDRLAYKHGIQPFWRKVGKERTRCIRLLLTESEYATIQESVKRNGNGQLAVYCRQVLLNSIEKEH